VACLDLPGHATVVSVTPVGRSSAWCGVPARWCTPNIVLTCIFLGAGLAVMDQFRGLHAYPIIHRLVSPCGDTLRTLLEDPCDLSWWTEAQNCCYDRNSYTANAGEHLEGNWITLGHLTRHERRACWSCLSFWSTDSTGNKTFWVTL
jgi:hypothetical protein